MISNFSVFSTNTLLLHPKILHNDCIRFLLGHEDDPREIENNAYANFWWVKEVYYGICASREYITGSHNKANKSTSSTLIIIIIVIMTIILIIIVIINFIDNCNKL